MTHWYLVNFGLGALVATAALRLGFETLERLHPDGRPVTLGDLICRSLTSGH